MAHNFALDEDDEYYLAIGRSTAAWATVEFLLDCLTAVAFKRFGGDQIEKSAPQNYGRKLKLLRRAFQTHPDARPFVAGLLPLLIRSEALNKTRKTMTHGTAMNSASGALSFRIFEFGEKGHTAVRHDIAARDFVAHADACLDLSDDLLKVAIDLIAFLGPNRDS